MRSWRAIVAKSCAGSRRSSSAARSSRRLVSSRAALRAAVCRAMTSLSAASNATSQNAIQCRPLRGTRDLKGAELRRPRARVCGNLLRIRNDGLLGQHASEGAPATGAYRLPRRANAVTGPLAERVLDDAILARVVRYDAQLAAGLERVAQLRQRGGEHMELFVDRDPQRRKQSREGRGTGAASQA